MTERADISVDWGAFSRSSPRIIEVASPSVTLTVQDLVDTLQSNSLSAGEAVLDNIDDDAIVTMSGKEDLGGGTLVGITAALQNARIRFQARLGPAVVRCVINGGNLVSFLSDTGSQTGADSSTVYIDSAGDFINFGLEIGMTVQNLADGSSTTVQTVDSANQCTCLPLSGGSDNLFQAGDEVVVSGFTNPIATAAFTTVVIQASSSATISETGVSGLTATEATQLAAIDVVNTRATDLWKVFGLEMGNKVFITPTGIVSEDGTVIVNFTGDGISSTVMDRQP